MTHEAVELSVQDGQPVELYKFESELAIFTYARIEDGVGITWNGRDYLPQYIERSPIPAVGTSEGSSLEVTLPDNVTISDLFRYSPLSGLVQLTIYRWHRGESELDYDELWSGRVNNHKWLEGRKLVITTEPAFTSVRRNGLKRKIQINCPHMLYGELCTLNRISWLRTYTVDGVSGNVATFTEIAGAGLDADYFAGGYIEWDNPNLITPSTERRFILSQSGNDLELDVVPYALPIGTSVKLYPGCNRTMDHCENKYSNLANYGGFPWRPNNNPFKGVGAIV